MGRLLVVHVAFNTISNSKAALYMSRVGGLESRCQRSWRMISIETSLETPASQTRQGHLKSTPVVQGKGLFGKTPEAVPDAQIVLVFQNGDRNGVVFSKTRLANGSPPRDLFFHNSSPNTSVTG